MKPEEQLNAVIDALNQAISDDPDAMQFLVSNFVPCNEKLADHDTIQVGKIPGRQSFYVGALGLLNGALSAAGLPRIAGCFETDVPKGETVVLTKFVKYEPKGASDENVYDASR